MHSGLLAILVFSVGFAVMPLVIRLAPVLLLIDHPDHRKGHRQPTPVVGGLGVAASLLVLLAAQIFLDAPGLWLWFCIVPLLLIGVIDDRIELSYRFRFVCHMLVGAVMAYVGGVALHDLGNLLGLGAILVGVMAVPLTMFAVASAVNSLNLIDGLDGLASGIALIPLIIMAPLCYWQGLDAQLTLCLVFIAATCAFMLYNFPGLRGKRPRTFLGDSGSSVLGFIGVYLLIDLSQRGVIYPITALYILAWPLMDTAAVIVRRRSMGLTPMTAGRDHIHHLLLDAGFGRTSAVLTIQIASLLFALLGLALMRFPEPVSFVTYIASLLAYLWFTRYPRRTSRALQQALNLPARGA